MTIELTLNGLPISAEASPAMPLLEFLRGQNCPSVKRGCGTQNCGLCTVWLEGKPVLACAIPVYRAAGRSVTTIEGVREEAAAMGAFLAARGAEQCGYCSPGFIMAVLAMRRALHAPTYQEMKAYLAGNLCRCSGYTGQMQAVAAWMEETK